MNDRNVGGVHWSFWIIGVVALIWHVMGCINFILQMNADTVAAMPELYRAIIEARSSWATGAFAIAVFGGALGCFLLLLRKSAAVYLFIVSLLGVIVTMIPYLGMPDVPIGIWIGSLMSLVVAAFLIWYSKWTKFKSWIS